MRSIIDLFLLLIFTSSSTGMAADLSNSCDSRKYKYSIGTELSAWALQGMSIVYSSVAGSCRLSLEYWQDKLPESFITMNDSESVNPWTEEREGYNLFLDTFYDKSDEGWYSGVGLRYIHSDISRELIDLSEELEGFEVQLRFGYKMNLGEHFAFEPGLAFAYLLSGHELQYQGETFKQEKFRMVPALHFFFSFNP